MTKTYDAIWGFKEDILELRKSFKERIIKAHTSQPLGIPLHMYEGKLALDKNGVSFSGKNKKSGENFELTLQRNKIKDVYLGWDEVLRRWRDTRAWIRPLRISFEDQERTKTLYIYAKKPEAVVYGKENKTLFNTLKQVISPSAPVLTSK